VVGLEWVDMKEILVISGSARKNGDGIKALSIFKDKFDPKDFNFQVVHLSDYNIAHCIGCTTCFKKEKCFLKDDLDTIIDMMIKADGFIFITPIYNMNISGLLKTFFDRTTYLLHKPVFYKKHSYVICSTDMGGAGHIKFYLKYMMNAYCIDNAGSTGVLSNKIRFDDNYINALSNRFDKEAKKFKIALAKEAEYNPKFTQLVRFNLWRIKGLKSETVYPGDYNYWSRDDLINAEYFYPVKIRGFKRVLIKVIKRRISRLIEKKM